MRKVKNEYLMDTMPHKVKNYILLNYEDILYNMNEILEKIQTTFLLIKKIQFTKMLKNTSVQIIIFFVDPDKLHYYHLL